MQPLKLSVLGGIRVEVEGYGPLHLPTDKIRGLLAYLVLQAGRPVRREVAATCFWADWPHAVALRNLRQSLHRLRKCLDQARPDLGQRLLTVTRQEITLNPAYIQVDAAEVVHHLDTVANHLHRALGDCPDCMQRLAAAVAGYGGELLAGFTIGDAPEFETWLLAARATLHRQVQDAAQQLAQVYQERGDYGQAYFYAQQELALEPWLESAHRRAMRALAALGRRSEALAHYELCRQTLARELDVEPDAETASLYAAIRAAGLDVPTQAVRIRHNLSTPLSPFIGRGDDLAGIQARLDVQRLVTLTGAGGSGKTRLCLEVGRRLLDRYVDGVWWIELATVHDARGFAQTLASTLRAPEAADDPPEKLLLNRLRGSQMLIILDNCEHLLAVCAPWVELVLGHCPGLSILATSRERLRVPGEFVWHVATLRVPPDRPCADAAAQDLPRLLSYEAVQLFVDRATARHTDFRLTAQNADAVVEICRRLDGIPLALELAAAHVGTLPITEIADMLGNRFAFFTAGSRTALPRHQTLWALIDWSYELLAPAEQRLLRRLAIFSAGWTLETLRAICTDVPDNAPDDAPDDAPDKAHVQTGSRSGITGDDQTVSRVTVSRATASALLARIVDQSLVAVREQEGVHRYTLLETLRAYAWTRLEQSGELDIIRDRYIQTFVALAEDAGAHLLTGEPRRLRRVQDEYDNLMVILEWAETAQHPAAALRDAAVRLAGYLANYWGNAEYLAQAQHWLCWAWENSTQATTQQTRARLASGLGTYFWFRCLNDEATRWHQVAREHYSQAEDWFGVSFSIYNLAFQSHEQGKIEAARTLYAEAIRLADEWRIVEVHALSLTGLALVHQEQAAIEAALDIYTQAETLLRGRNAQRLLGHLVTFLIDIRLEQGEMTAAHKHMQELVAIVRQTNDVNLGLAAELSQAQVAHAQGHYHAAALRLGKLLAGFAGQGLTTYALQSLELFGCLLPHLNEPESAAILLDYCAKNRAANSKRQAPFYPSVWTQARRLLDARLTASQRESTAHAATELSFEAGIRLALHTAQMLHDNPPAHAHSVPSTRTHTALTDIRGTGPAQRATAPRR